MVRVRAPAGRLTAAQCLALDALAGPHADGTLRLTTRQGVQFHTRAARQAEALHRRHRDDAADHHGGLRRRGAQRHHHAPRRAGTRCTRGWSARPSASPPPCCRAPARTTRSSSTASPSAAAEEEPLYGPTYLPRKFKMSLAHAADNTPDVLSNDLGFIALTRGRERSRGWIVTDRRRHGHDPQQARHLPPPRRPRHRRSAPDEVLSAWRRAVVRLFRDHGDRSRPQARAAEIRRRRARRGLGARAPVPSDLGAPLRARPAPAPAACRNCSAGTRRATAASGSACPSPPAASPTRARTRCGPRCARWWSASAPIPIATPQQDLILSNLRARATARRWRPLLRGHGVVLAEDLSPLARWSLACTALPTCGQALTEAERVHAPIVAQFEASLARHGLLEERISLRLTGCPNGCARPYAGDIGVVGPRRRAVYALFVGGDFEGTRLSFPLADKVKRRPHRRRRSSRSSPPSPPRARPARPSATSATAAAPRRSAPCSAPPSPPEPMATRRRAGNGLLRSARNSPVPFHRHAAGAHRILDAATRPKEFRTVSATLDSTPAATRRRTPPCLDAATLRRVAAFIDGPGRVIVLFAIVLMFVRIFLD